MQCIVTQLLGNKLPNSSHCVLVSVSRDIEHACSNPLHRYAVSNSVKVAFTYPNSLCVLVPTKNHAAAHYRKQLQTVNTNVSTPGTLYR